MGPSVICKNLLKIDLIWLLQHGLTPFLAPDKTHTQNRAQAYPNIWVRFGHNMRTFLLTFNPSITSSVVPDNFMILQTTSADIIVLKKTNIYENNNYFYLCFIENILYHCFG